MTFFGFGVFCSLGDLGYCWRKECKCRSHLPTQLVWEKGAWRVEKMISLNERGLLSPGKLIAHWFHSCASLNSYVNHLISLGMGDFNSDLVIFLGGGWVLVLIKNVRRFSTDSQLEASERNVDVTLIVLLLRKIFFMLANYVTLFLIFYP